MHTETDAKYRLVDMHVDVPTVANAKFFHFGVRNFPATTEFVKSRQNFPILKYKV